MLWPTGTSHSHQHNITTYSLPKKHIVTLLTSIVIIPDGKSEKLYKNNTIFVGFAYQGKNIVFRFIIDFSSLQDFGL
jgi:hypothetical protein